MGLINKGFGFVTKPNPLFFVLKLPALWKISQLTPVTWPPVAGNPIRAKGDFLGVDTCVIAEKVKGAGVMLWPLPVLAQ